MKNIILMLMIVVFSRQLSAQNVAINNTAATADASAMLDVSSTSKGLLIPRMSTTAINLIINPAKGLLVYDSVINRLMVNMGTPATPTWQNIALSGGWSLTGNGGTNPLNNFLGTTDAKPLSFRVNNVNAGFIDNSTTGIVALGYQSLLANTTGFGNTGHGYNSLTANTTGSRNTAIGFYSLYTNNADNNTAVGTYSLSSNTTGTGNTAAGVNSLVSNIQGNYNSAFGTNSLYTNTSGTENTANGYGALFSNTTGNSNSAFGKYSLYTNGNGNNNTAIGFNSLYFNSTGSNNTATGSTSLQNNISGSYNTAAGDNALAANITGNSNTANGYNSLQLNTSSLNTGIGQNALAGNTTGTANTGVGFQTMESNSTGNNNTAIGALANVVGEVSNATAIGAIAAATESNSIQLGNLSVTKVNTAGNIFVNGGKGLIRSNDGTQQKKVTTIVPVNVSLEGEGTFIIPFSFTESFSAVPDVYLGNIVIDNTGSEFYELMIMTISDVTTTGGKLHVHNSQAVTNPLNFSIKVIAIGPQ